MVGRKRAKKIIFSVFGEHFAKIKRGPVPLGAICEDLEEMFMSGLNKRDLLVMPHLEKKGEFLIVKGVSPSGKFIVSSEHMGPANALDPKTREVFAIKIKPNNEISLRHIGKYSDVGSKDLPKIKRHLKNSIIKKN